MAHFERVLGIGNHRTGIHLRACACHRQYATHGQQSLVLSRVLLLQPELVPVVAFVIDGCRHRLRVVAHAAATEGENQVHLVLAGNFHTLAQFLQRGVGHHARVLDDGLASLLEDGHHLVVDAVALHTAAAVIQQHHWAVALQFVLEVVQGLITKIQFGGIVIRKVS